MEKTKEFVWFYHTEAWHRVRDYVWKRDSGLCQDCASKGIVKAGVDVHHIIPLTKKNVKDESIALNPQNLILLCKECHNERHDRRQRRYKVDANGRIYAP